MKIEWNYKINITKEQWKELFLNENIIKDFNKDLILRIYKKHNYMATATEIANDQGRKPNSYNFAVGALGKRIVHYLNIEPPRQKEDTTKFDYWHVMFLGAIEKDTGHFIWILRPEFKIAIDEIIQENKILLKNKVAKEVITIPEEITEEQSQKLKEGAKYRITVNAYERNPKAKNQCIEYYKKLNNGKVVCQICGFDFGDFYGEEAEGRIHVHHLKPLHEIGEQYEINAINDLILICPNCHLVIHSKEPAYKPEDIKKLIKNCNLEKVKEELRMTELGKSLIQEGMKEGREEGKSELLIKMLIKKFKKLPDEYKKKIKSLPEETLEIIATDIFEMNSIEELEQYF